MAGDNFNKPSTTKITKALKAPKNTTMSCSEEEKLRMKKPYMCVTCGRRYSTQRGNFTFSQSPLFESNNHFLPTCNNCLDSLVEQYTELLGDEDAAVERVCLHYDIYVDRKRIEASKRGDSMQTKIRDYIRQCNLKQFKGKTYDTYLSETGANNTDTNVITTIEDVEKFNAENSEKDTAKLSSEAVERWGVGYDPSEYKMLDTHYKMLKDKAGDDDVKDALIKDLCEQYIMKYRARKEKDIDRYEKISKLYQQTLANADLKPKDNSKNGMVSDPDEVWGVFTSIVEKYSPAEFIKENGISIFKDFNSQDEYYRRFICRPTNNLINGTNDMDSEFEIKDGDGDDE